MRNKSIFAVLGDVWDWRESQRAGLHEALPPIGRKSAARQERHTDGSEILLALAGAEIREESKGLQEQVAVPENRKFIRLGHWTVAEGELRQ